MATKSKKSKEITIRSSAAEYLTFVSAIGDQPDSVELRYQDENIWLTQRLMAELYGVDVRTINEHILKIYSDKELEEEATIRNFQIVQAEGTLSPTSISPLPLLLSPLDSPLACSFFLKNAAI